MTDQHLPDRLVEERLHGLALAAPVPTVDPADDLARGGRRVRRRRLAVGAGALATAAVIVGAGAVALGNGGPGPADDVPAAASPTASDPVPTTPPPTTPPSTPAAPADDRTTEEYLLDLRDVVADTLDPAGEHLDRRVTNYQGSGGGLGTKLGWSNPGEDGLGVVEVFVSKGWASQAYMWCDRYQRCRDVSAGGVEGRTMEEGSTTWVGVQHPDGGPVVVLSVDALFGNNSVVPVSGLDLSVRDLLRAAADERFTTPTAAQLNGDVSTFPVPQR